MQQTLGIIYITDKNFYFQPFHNFSDHQVEVIHLDLIVKLY